MRKNITVGIMIQIDLRGEIPFAAEENPYSHKILERKMLTGIMIINIDP